jgi:hypothetical protein
MGRQSDTSQINKKEDSMKKLRAAFLTLTVGMLAFNQFVVHAEADTCWCNELSTFCDGFCYQHGGTIFYDCHVGMGCLEVCFCGDGEQYAEGAHYCPPCN